DKSGATITSNGPFPNTRPDHFVFTDRHGNKTKVAAADFLKTLNGNDDFRAAFHRAYNPLFVGFKDAVFKAIQARFGFRENNSSADGKDEKDIQRQIDDSVKG